MNLLESTDDGDDEGDDGEKESSQETWIMIIIGALFVIAIIILTIYLIKKGK